MHSCTQADIFSLSILLWELLHGTSLTTTILRVALDPASQQEALTSYAAATAAGYRWVCTRGVP